MTVSQGAKLEPAVVLASVRGHGRMDTRGIPTPTTVHTCLN